MSSAKPQSNEGISDADRSMLRKSGGAGDSFINFNATNSGTIAVQTGTLQLSGPLAVTTRPTSLRPGTTTDTVGICPALPVPCADLLDALRLITTATTTRSRTTAMAAAITSWRRRHS